MSKYAISVRDLAAFCHRSGDIDHRFTPSPTAEQGMEGHLRVYRRRPGSYQREFAVASAVNLAGVELLLRGRADGFDSQQGLVEEIKTCRVPAQTIPEHVTRQHLAQGRIYAALIAAAEDCAEMLVRLTWFNIDSGEEHAVEQRYSRGELDEFLAATLDHFSEWLGRLVALREARDLGLAQLKFPHGDFRRGQREIAELVYKCIDQGGQLMVEAPTGIGKTMAVLYPALKALALGKHDALVFVTARTVGRRTAEDSFELIARQGPQTRALSLTAKEKICFSPGKACHGDDCPFARGYYDRLGSALRAALELPALRRSDIEMLAREHEICPYQLADDLLPWVDIVIADIHYIYSLTPRLGNHIAQGERRWTVLLDEAHNLPDRARSMYSAKLSKRELMSVKRANAGSVARALQRVNRELLDLLKEQWPEGEVDSRKELPEKAVNALGDFVAAVGEAMADDAGFLPRNPELMNFYFDVLQWLRVAERWGDDFLLELQRGKGTQGLTLQLNCLDPSRLLMECQQRLHAVVAFSATLSPPHWMRATLGLSAEAVSRRMDSPFVASQLAVTLATDIDTRYRAREQSLEPLAGRIGSWLQDEPGNCIVYFSSYRYMAECLERLEGRGALAGRRQWRQQQGMDEASREELLRQFTEHRNLAAFCILGGVFGEGIDLPGEHLSSVVVVGVGLPQVGRQRQQLRDWYQQQLGTGFEYAYLYPGMQKVDQALGRVVRTATDSGSALLIDVRYDWPQYRDLLPPWWHYGQ
jgi:DNA excision repair protein ERCC-2